MHGTMSVEVLEQQYEEIAARGGVEPPEEKSVASGSQEARYLPVGLGRGVGAGEDPRYPPQVLQGSEKRRLGLGETAWTNRGTLIL